MNRSDSIKELAGALAKAQAEIDAASKDSLNPHFKSRYADLAAIWDACRAQLTKHGLSVVQIPSATGPEATVMTMLLHESGEWIAGELTLTSQQATPQGIGSAITYARRYSLAAMVGVAPDDDDGNAASGQQGNGRRARGEPPAEAVDPIAKASAAIVNATTEESLDRYDQAVEERLAEGIYTVDQGDKLQKLIAVRRKAMKASKEPATA